MAGQEQVWAMLSNLVLPTVLIIIFLLAIGVYFLVSKWRKKQVNFPVTAIIFDRRSDNTVIKLDRARREKSEDKSECYLLKNAKLKFKPISTSNIFTGSKIIKKFGILKQYIPMNVVFLLMNSKEDVIPLNLDIKNKELKPQVPEESKLWWLNSMKKRKEIWEQKSWLLQVAPYVFGIIVFLISFLLVAQAVNSQVEMARVINQASGNIALLKEYNMEVVDSMEKMSKHLGLILNATTSPAVAPK